ncbi:hypothetical protein NW767_010480 [Fusarium falciforme]|nr:hypothetical protein NW767_010480 [Fusarium falciforme]
MDESTLEEATRLWTGSIRSAKISVLHASCVFEIVRKYRSRFYSISVMLFKAVLTLWSYSKFLLPKFEVTKENTPGRYPTSALLGCSISKGSTDLWLNNDHVVAKLGGIGNLDSASARRKMLDEAVTLMQMDRVWMLGQSYAKCLVRLKEKELVPTVDLTD